MSFFVCVFVRPPVLHGLCQLSLILFLRQNAKPIVMTELVAKDNVRVKLVHSMLAFCPWEEADLQL